MRFTSTVRDMAKGFSFTLHQERKIRRLRRELANERQARLFAQAEVERLKKAAA